MGETHRKGCEGGGLHPPYDGAVAAAGGRNSQFLSKLAEIMKTIRLEEPDHETELLQGCIPQFTTTAEYSAMYDDFPRAARFWSFRTAFALCALRVFAVRGRSNHTEVARHRRPAGNDWRGPTRDRRSGRLGRQDLPIR